MDRISLLTFIIYGHDQDIEALPRQIRNLLR